MKKEIKKRILVVDDNIKLRQLLSERLRFQGHEVDAVGGGFQALTFLEKNSYDLLMVDMGLKDMSVEEVLMLLGGENCEKVVPKLIMADEMSAERMQELLVLGATDYILKTEINLDYQNVAKKVSNILQI